MQWTAITTKNMSWNHVKYGPWYVQFLWNKVLMKVVHLKTPFVTDLPGQVEVHFSHKESVTGSGQAWWAAAIRSSHIAWPIEVPEILVSYKRTKTELWLTMSFSIKLVRGIPTEWQMARVYLVRFHLRVTSRAGLHVQTDTLYMGLWKWVWI